MFLWEADRGAKEGPEMASAEELFTLMVTALVFSMVTLGIAEKGRGEVVVVVVAGLDGRDMAAAAETGRRALGGGGALRVGFSSQAVGIKQTLIR